jgi:hypothetical protein
VGIRVETHRCQVLRHPLSDCCIWSGRGDSNARPHIPGYPPAPERPRHIDRHGSLRLDSFCFIEAARDEQRTPHLNPSRFRQTAQSRADSIPLRECHMIEIQRAHCWHGVISGQDYFRRQSSNRRVAGTTMTSFRRSMSSLRVRMRTGRRSSGSRNVYQRISRRLNRYPPTPRHPNQAARRPQKTRRAKVVRTGKRMRRRPVVSQSTAEVAHVLGEVRSRPAVGYRQPSKLWPSLEF